MGKSMAKIISFTPAAAHQDLSRAKDQNKRQQNPHSDHLQNHHDEGRDSKWVHDCANGDTEALGKLFDQYVNDVYRFLARLNFVQTQEIDDLVQETFLAVLGGAKRFKKNAKVRTWILGIAANKARERVRKAVREKNFRSRRADYVRLLYLGTEPETQAINNQDFQILISFFKHLPANQQLALTLCDVEGLSGLQAAKALGVPKGTLYRWLSEARRFLRQKIEAGGRS